MAQQGGFARQAERFRPPPSFERPEVQPPAPRFEAPRPEPRVETPRPEPRREQQDARGRNRPEHNPD